ncbi:MAG: hypothetical protein FWE69_08700, partial [Clostridiales bacterium]|nr:hypothetical protein [Clostridiales bacterium]
MKPAKSYFNTTVFFRNIRRNWPLWALYLFAWIVTTIIEIVYRGHFYENSVIKSAIYGGLIFNAVFAILAALAVYSYMFEIKRASLIHSLPTRREGLFLSSFASGLSFMIVPNLIITLFLLPFGLTMSTLSTALVFDYLLRFLGVTCACSVIFFGIASFCAMLAGSKWSLALVYGIVNFAAVAGEAIVRWVLSLFVFGLTGFNSEPILAAFSPFLQLGYKLEEVGEFGRIVNWYWLPIYAAVGFALSVAAVFLYKKRHIETASDPIVIKQVRPVFKYVMT